MRRRSKSLKSAMLARDMHLARDRYILERYGAPEDEIPCGEEYVRRAGECACVECDAAQSGRDAHIGRMHCDELNGNIPPNECEPRAAQYTAPPGAAGPPDAQSTRYAQGGIDAQASCGDNGTDAHWCEALDYVMTGEGVLEPIYSESAPDDDAGAQQAYAENVLDLPAYLRAPDLGRHVYGTLSYNARARVWTIRGEPCVVELAKRLFPGCDGRGRGVARFAAHARIVGDLNWLMLRYPLEIAARDAKRWQGALDEARHYALRRERARLRPSRVSPPATFTGELMPFQQLGLGFLMDNPRALLADEMGLGKTVQALALLCARRAFPAMIVAPPHLVRNWEREISRFVSLPGGTRVHVLRGLAPYKLPEADVYIVHYLLLRGWKRELARMELRAVVFDEIQELRHAGTEKYSAATLLAGDRDIVIGLSGTPIYNRGGEIWNVINAIDYHFLGDWESFTREWCCGYGADTVADPEKLGEYLKREGMMLRRTKRDVLPELPPKRRLVQEIDWDDEVYREYMRPVVDSLRALRGETDASRRAIIEDAISQTERQATGIAKAPYVCACVRTLLEAGERVLLFAHHHAVMDIYARELKRWHPAFITGREDERAKDAAVRGFMDGSTDLCCISLRSASGLNLQRATCVVFGELDWSPAVHSQAEDRAHRIGQRDSLLCYYLVSPRGSDQEMQLALGLKVSQFVGLMGDSAPTPEQQALLASQARDYISQLVHRLDGELLPVAQQADGAHAGAGDAPAQPSALSPSRKRTSRKASGAAKPEPTGEPTADGDSSAQASSSTDSRKRTSSSASAGGSRRSRASGEFHK
ncbi:MAG: DEAD/DEAH box helicase [Candidatus Fimadaptatus sp.]